jgi:hypothetical protein
MSYYRFIARISHSTFRFMGRLCNFLDTFHSGFWLGVMSEKSLEFSDELFYNRSMHYMDDKYNLSGLFEWEKVLINKHFSNLKSILLIAAGGGREALALIKMGYDVDSYECNASLIAYGNALLKKNQIDSVIKYLPRNTVPIDKKKYDGIIIGWGAYSLIQGSKKRHSFLTALQPFLNKTTPLMISFLWVEKKSRKDKMIKDLSDFFRIFSKKDKTELGDRLVPDFIHYFDEEEIKGEIIQSNLKLIDYYSSDYGCIIACI